MNESLNRLQTRVQTWWQSTDPTRRLRLGAMIMMGLVVLIVGIGFLTRTNWQPLYNNLSTQSAGQIPNQLTQMKVPYQLTNQGRTVLVPAAQVDQVRVDLASANIPSSGTVGLPTPVNFSLGETTQEIQINQLINTEATLEATINSIAGVKSSKVMINQPAPSLFGEGPSQASASVFVDLNPGAVLSPSQVRGIMNLVAHAVSGLSLRQVSVVNQNGTVLSQGALSGPSPLSAVGQAGQQLAAEQAVDNQVAGQVGSLLTQMLGPGNAVVRVHATLNFNNREVRQIMYGRGVLANQTKNLTASKSKGAALPAAGAKANVPVYPTALANGPSSSSSNNVTNHYDVNQTVSNQTIPAGGIQRMTVAVALDQTMTPAKLRAIRNLVVQAAGLNLRAGDQVDILAAPFNHSLVKSALASMAATQRANRMRQQIEAAIAFLALVLIIVGIRRMLKTKTQRRLELAESQELYLTGGNQALKVADYLPDHRLEEIPSVYEQAKQHLTTTARQNPETVARLIRTWLAEDD